MHLQTLPTRTPRIVHITIADHLVLPDRALRESFIPLGNLFIVSIFFSGDIEIYSPLQSPCSSQNHTTTQARTSDLPSPQSL